MTPEDLIDLIESGDEAGAEAALRADPALVGQHAADFIDQPLHYACKHAHLAIAGIAIGYGADVDAIGEHAQTPLHYTVHDGDERAVPFVAALLRLGADPNLRDKANRDVEERAKIGLDGGLPNVLDLLRRRGQPAGSDRGDLSPLIAAGDVMGVANALKANTASASGAALSAACARGQLAIVAVLLGYGVAIGGAGGGDTPLLRAAKLHTLDGAAIAGILLAAGAPWDAQVEAVADEMVGGLLAHRRP